VRYTILIQGVNNILSFFGSAYRFVYSGSVFQVISRAIDSSEIADRKPQVSTSKKYHYVARDHVDIKQTKKKLPPLNKNAPGPQGT